MPNYKVSPVWISNWEGRPPVFRIGRNMLNLTGQLDLRKAYSAVVYIQVVHYAHTTSQSDPGIQIRIKREVGCPQYAPPWEGRVGETTRMIQPVFSSSVTLLNRAEQGQRYVQVASGSGFPFDIQTGSPDLNLVALLSDTYMDNFEIHRVSQLQQAVGADTVKLDASLEYVHKSIFSDVDKIYTNPLCMEPMELPGGAMYDLLFECIPPIEANYLIRWWADIYVSDKPSIIL